jgi:hypothetical protein
MANLSNNAVSNEMAFGQHGGAYITGAHTPPTGKVVVAVMSLHDNTEFTDADTGFPQIDGVAIPKGITIYGRWTTVTVGGTSGAAIVYYGPKNG